MSHSLKFLLIQDNDDDVKLLEETLLKIAIGHIISRATSFQEAENYIAGLTRYDLVLLDLDLEDSSGLETLMRIREGASYLPIVVLTRSDNEALSYAAIQAGAQDYLVKGKTPPELLKKTLLNAVFRFQIVSKINSDSNEEKAYFATHDVLTGLPSEQVFLGQLRYNISKCELSKRTFSVVILQIYETDMIEQNFGVFERDKLIKMIASMLTKEKNHTVLVCRIKETLFGIIVQKIENIESLINYMNVVQNHLNFKFNLKDREYSPVYSLGASIYPFDGRDVAGLLSTAMIAKKRAEEFRFNHYEIYNKNISINTEPVIFHSDILNALERNEFSLYYQPLLNIQKNMLHGFEALVRWNHPKLGRISPHYFIPIVEEYKLITQLGEWLISTVCKQLHQWKMKTKVPLELSVDINVSIQQLETSDLYDFFKKCLKKHDILAHEMGIELTESIFLSEPDKVVRKLHDLKDLGIKIAIDDFGKGYSSLSYLNHLPIDYLKLDIEFIKDLTVSREKQYMVKSLIQLAHDLNIKVVAEGVEMEGQKKWLFENNCDIIQGYLYGKPQPIEEIEKNYL